MKLVAKRAELMQLTQNFMPRTRIGIFGNERMRSTPLDPKLNVWSLFRSVWVYLSMFRYYMKLGTKWVELVQLMHKFVP